MDKQGSIYYLLGSQKGSDREPATDIDTSNRIRPPDRLLAAGDMRDGLSDGCAGRLHTSDGIRAFDDRLAACYGVAAPPSATLPGRCILTDTGRRLST